MKKYKVSISIPFIYDEVEAENEERAYAKADEMAREDLDGEGLRMKDIDFDYDSCVEEGGAL